MPLANLPPDPGTPQGSNLITLDATKYALTALGVALLCVQLVLCDRISFDDLRFSALCAAALGVLVWSRRKSLAIESDAASITVGMALIGAFLFRSSGQPGTLFVTIGPVLWGAGLALLASGARGLGQYWREAMLLAAVVVTPFIETLALDLAGVDLAPSTAQATALLLRLGGWEASARDVLVGLPTGWVVVSQGCSGLKTMYFLAGFAAIVLVMFPVPGLLRKIALLIGAVAIGFLVNTLRVALLAVLASPAHHQAFQFWHIHQGAMFVEAVAVVVFLGFYYVVVPAKPAAPQHLAPSGK